jgi:hypothetical protein
VVSPNQLQTRAMPNIHNFRLASMVFLGTHVCAAQLRRLINCVYGHETIF